MYLTTWKRLSIGLLSAVLAVGCATGAPQRSPGGNTVQGSTTGNLDACSVALGNANTGGTTGGAGGAAGTAGGAAGTTGGTAGTAGGTAGTAGGTAGTAGGTAGTAGGAPSGAAGTAGSTAGNNAGAPPEVTANGVMVGNVAVVALPTHDNLPTTSHGGGPTGTPAAAPGTTAGGGGGTTGTAGAPTGTGTAYERTGTGTPGTTGTGTTGGMAGGAGGATGTTGTANTTALDRIRASCRGLTEIRVVTDATDRTRLAEISMAMRRGVPVTEYMDEIARISRKATIAGGASGAGGGGTTAAPGGGATTAPANR